MEDIPGKEKIEDYITELHKKFKQKTIKRKIASVKAYYNFLEERKSLVTTLSERSKWDLRNQ